jgi:hypothetical protein
MALPVFGFELPVRVCKECVKNATPEDRAPVARIFPPLGVFNLRLVDARGVPSVLICHADRTVKVLDKYS